MKPTLGKKGRPLAVAVCRVGPERKTLGSGLNVGNIGAEIDVIQPALPAQTHAPIAIHFAFGVSRTSFLDRLAYFVRLALHNFSTRRSFIAPSLTP
jgi:hypothetical protein